MEFVNCSEAASILMPEKITHISHSRQLVFAMCSMPVLLVCFAALSIILIRKIRRMKAEVLVRYAHSLQILLVTISIAGSKNTR